MKCERGDFSGRGAEDRIKIIVCITVIAFIISGCTTLRPVDLIPPSLQDRITQGDLIKPGNRVRITTTDEKTYKFRILSVSDGYVKGKDVEIPINLNGRDHTGKDEFIIFYAFTRVP
jgi:LEA14-like dessication related protein